MSKNWAVRRQNRQQIADSRYQAGEIKTLMPRLRELGFKRYSDYLSATHWQEFRKKVLSERGTSCEVCGAVDKRIALHHRTYERLGCEISQDVVLVCPDCHDRIHKSERMGGKGGLEGALRRIKLRVLKSQDAPKSELNKWREKKKIKGN